MKRVKSVVLAVLICIMAMALPISVNAAKLNKTEAVVSVTKTIKLKVTGTSKKVKWKSSNKKVATVSSKGVVTGKKAGSAKITAQVGKEKYVCQVTVRPNEFKATWDTIRYTGLSFFVDRVYYKSGDLVVKGYLCNGYYFSQRVKTMSLELYDKTSKTKLLAKAPKLKVGKVAAGKNITPLTVKVPKKYVKQKKYDLGSIRLMYNKTSFVYY